jgi:putative transposase
MKRKPQQLEFQKVNGWGGKRRGAGRPNRSGTVSHMKRDKVDFKKPLSLTMKVKRGVPSLRQRMFLKGFKQSIQGARDYGLHVVHYSLLHNHIHVIIEAKNNKALGAGIRSLAGRFGKFIRKNSEKRLKGSVFTGRYHMRALKTPTEMKNALEYVLLNQAKHSNRIEHMDHYSSADQFTEWQKLLGKRFKNLIQDEVEDLAASPDLYLSPPRSWLCRQGWMRACY